MYLNYSILLRRGERGRTYYDDVIRISDVFFLVVFLWFSGVDLLNVLPNVLIRSDALVRCRRNIVLENEPGRRITTVVCRIDGGGGRFVVAQLGWLRRQRQEESFNRPSGPSLDARGRELFSRGSCKRQNLKRLPPCPASVPLWVEKRR